ncbi:MAG: C69 family dipeptidase [Synergistaceae bacterium]|jgi:dipeptidase|nr:C69 family dipeptidase [Synergistaceae bacterium]
MKPSNKVLGSVLVVLCLMIAAEAWADCTSVMVGKKATADGSVLVSYTCDGWYDHRLVVVPGGTHKPGETVEVNQNVCYQTRPDRPLKKVGEIPQVEKTYTYFHVGYPIMNEKSVVMGEYTWGGREENENAAGWFMIESLQILGLQRGATAREVIRVIGELAEKYGYGDGGEALTIGDKDEIWLFEICGPGPLWTPESGKPGAIWAAVRVPDDSYAMGSNRSRIAAIDFQDRENFMYSSNVKTFAQEMGWWKEGEPFVFHKIYNPVPYGSPYYQQRREWRAYNLLSPSVKLAEDSAEQYPLFQKPDKPLRPQDLMALNRDVLQGTRFDMTKGPDAGPFGSPTRYALTRDQKPENRKLNDWNRTINLFRCSYSFVGQVRANLPEPLSAVAWFGEDQPITTLYMPVYAGTKKVPESYSTGDRTKFDMKSTWWAFNFVANWAELRFNAIIEDIRAEQRRLEEKFFAAQPEFEKKAADLYKKDPKKAQEMVTQYVNDTMTEVDKDWWALAWNLVGKYSDGYQMTPEGKQLTLGYPTDWLERVGFGDNDAEPKK